MQDLNVNCTCAADKKTQCLKILDLISNDEQIQISIRMQECCCLENKYILYVSVVYSI